MNVRLRAISLISLGLLIAACDDDKVTVFPAKLEVDPTTLDLGGVQLGTEKTGRIRVKNTGEGVLRLKGVVAAGELDPSFTFTLETLEVPPNSETNLDVTFRPTELGERTGALVVQPNDPTLTDLPVTIRALGVTAELEVTPSTLSFGNVVVDTSKTLQVTVKNISDVTAFVQLDLNSNVKLCGGSVADSSTFCVQPPAGAEPDGSFELAPSASVDLDISFRPTIAGFTERGRLRLRGCEQASCEADIRFDGQGIEQGFRCDPPSLAFGQVNPGSCLTKQAVCENIANEQVTIVGWRKADIGGTTSSADFTVEPFSGAEVLAEGDTVSVDVTYCPNDLGNDRGSLELETDNPDARRKYVVVELTGTGGGPDIQVQPLEINFGQVSLIAPARRNLGVTNVGFDTLAITEVIADARNTGAFRAPTAGADNIPVGGFKAIPIEFQPIVEGPVESEVVIKSNDQDEPEIRIIVRGEGVNLPPCSFEVVPDHLVFGAVERGRTISRAFEIRNTGDTECLLTSARLADDPAQVFSLPDGDITSERIASRASATIRVGYSPSGLGNHMGSVEFSISSPASPFNTVALSGTGADGSLLIVPNDIDFGVLGVGCSARARTVSVYNTSSLTARIDSITLASGAPAMSLTNVPAPLPAAPLNIAPGSSISFDVGFRADAVSEYAGAVEINGTFNGQTVTYVVALQGRGALDARQTDEFDQLGKPKVDILFIVDDSCSMSEEQDSLATNFGAFIQFAQAQQLDYQIGVTTTDVQDGNVPEDGQLVPLTGPPADRIVTPLSQPSPEALFSQNANVGIDDFSSVEQGLEAAYLALSSPLTFGHNAGFLRSDAVLSVIIVSDEEDQSRQSVDFYVNFLLSIKGFRNTNLFTLSGIVGDFPGGCSGPGGSASSDERYQEAIRRTGGIETSICTADWSRALEDLSVAAFGFKSRFFLSNQPELGSLRVWVNDVAMPERENSGTVNWFYDYETNSVNFSPFSTPEPGAHLRVEYAVACL
ncbi:MAG: choice-of-anchor D domain-containing protein [Deltaproteobacteria bacterium]|nr:choice-of-anchor D domain-containing protein [Deltaproteobacteria bacterium]